MATEFGVYHLADNPAQYQPVRTNNFKFIIQDPKFQKLLRVQGNADNDADYIYNAEEIIDYSVVSFTAPHFSQEPIQVNRGNSKMYFAGVPTFTEGTLVINDFAGADGKSILEAWQNLSYDVENDIIPSSDVYKMKATVIEYLPDNTPLKEWDLHGCWVMKLDEDGWTNENGGTKKVTATIKFDKAIPHKPE